MCGCRHERTYTAGSGERVAQAGLGGGKFGAKTTEEPTLQGMLWEYHRRPFFEMIGILVFDSTVPARQLLLAMPTATEW